MLFMWWGRGYSSLIPSSAKPMTLSEKELAVLFAFCDRLLPDVEGQPTAREARIAERIDKELSFHTPKMQSDVKAALLLVEHGGILHLSGSRFTRLSPEEQDAHLGRMTQGRELERQAFTGLRTLAMFFYYCDERTWKNIGYVGPLMPRRKPEADSSLEESA